MRELRTVRGVVETLGGSTAIAELTGQRTVQAVSNWLRPDRNKIPPAHYAVVTDALNALGFTAPLRLFGQTQRPSAGRSSLKSKQRQSLSA